MKRYIPAVAMVAAAACLLTISPALAQIGPPGPGAGGGLGDAPVTWFYTNFMHAIAVVGLFSILTGALFMRSHMKEFVVAGIALLCIGNYQSILSMFNL